MSAHNLQSVLEAAVLKATGEILEVTGEGDLVAWGESTPADASTGYAKGGVFFNTTTGAILINEGTKASAAFRSVQTASALSATAYWEYVDAVGEGQPEGASDWTVTSDARVGASATAGLLVFPLSLPPGVVITGVGVKADGAGSTLTATATLQKRAERSGSATTWTNVGTSATQTGTTLATVEETFTGETVVEGTSYRVVVDAGKTGGSDGDVSVYAVGIKRTRG